MIKDALIGHTGFVGGSLVRQHSFASCFNSSNIDSIIGKEFDTLVCAAAPGSMFTANRNPDFDRMQIESLISHLDEVRARRVVLISSIAVLEKFGAGDDESTQAFQTSLPYGRHRRQLELFCESRFEQSLIIRLPALFGPGLRKNFIFDLLNPAPSILTEARLEELLVRIPRIQREGLARFYTPDTAGTYRIDREAFNSDPLRNVYEDSISAVGMSSSQFHNPNTTFQYYDLNRLWQDICLAMSFKLSHLHLATEPLLARDIYEQLRGTEMPCSSAPLHREDMHTLHAALWKREGPYLEEASAVLKKLTVFFAAEKKAK